MNRKRAIYLVVSLLWFAVQQALPQVYKTIENIPNKYTSITTILSAQGFNADTVVVTDANGFDVDDTVMVYCVKGASIITDFIGPYTPGMDAQVPGNTGKYAFFLIAEKIGNSLVLNASLNPEILPMGAGEVAQLIKVRSYRYASVPVTGVTAEPWDPVTGTGGVVAMFVHGVLRLDGDIDVSGLGFRGAPGSTDTQYTLGCLDGDTMGYFYLDGEVWAGLKGEGTTDTMFPFNRGKGSNINGGGGGNGLLAGGGGGSNHSAGVRGGNQSTVCNPQGDSITGGAGGFDLGRNGWYYVNEPAPLSRRNRIFFGGGGGSGTRPAGSTTTDGGNGGGIVVIVADTILGNGGNILANGEDVTVLATDGAGAGGGGGGCIILDVNGYQSTFTVSATGGDGGNTFGTDTTGPGGAGGGGIYWMSGTSHPGVTFDFSTGQNGQHINSGYEVPITTNPPFQKDNLVVPLRGFVFNPVPTVFTICSDQDPDPIVTSTPKGGDGSYTYQWIDSSSTQQYWADIVGATSRDYDPDFLSDTVYYRRIVTSAGLVDTSFRIDVYVHPAITDNTIAANDTVCSGNAPILFGPSATIGGGPTGGSYTYKWQQMPEGAGTFADITGTSADPTYQSGPLTTTTDFRRIAYSGVCVSTSDTGQVKVFVTLTGNDITPFDTICVNTVPDLISGPVPSDGDQGDIRYQWLTSTSPGVMGTLIPGETAISYQSPALSQTTYIRRVVLSGNDDACRDTSAYVEILNVPDITTNTIGSDQTVCQQDQPALLTGSSPGGGYLGQYTYTWESSTDQSSWVPATGGGPNDVQSGFDPGVMTGDTTWYRRVVGSGGLELVCRDTSTQLVINVLPSITNNVVTPADDLKCQQEMPEIITGSLPGGGATVAGNDPTQAFRWEVAQLEGAPGPGNWNHPLSGADARDYTDPELLSTDVDRWYQRIVTSGPAGQCIDTSNLVHLVVHSEITANAIDAAEAICFNDTRALRHMTLAGGETGITPVYTWRSWLEGETSADAVDIAGSDQQEYMSGPYNDPGTLVYYYDRVVEIGACSDTSNAMLVTVMQLPGGELTDAGFDACEKDSSLQLDLNRDGMTPGHYVTPWEVYLTDGINTGIGPGSLEQDPDTVGIVLDTEGADDVTLTYSIESIRYYPEGDQYYCLAPPANITGGPVVVNVFRRPDPQILVDGNPSGSFKVCSTTALLEFRPDNGTLSSWSEPAGSVFFSPGSGQDEYNVSIPNLHDEFGEYRIFIESQAGDCAGRDSIDLTYFEQPAQAVARLDTILWGINTVQLRADPPTAGIGTWTLTEGSGEIVDEHDPNTVVNGLVLEENTFFTWTVTNGEGDFGTCSPSDSMAFVLVHELKKYNGFSPNGDMSNEYFIMRGLVYADAFSITFFNSLGKPVRTITQENVDELEVDEALVANGLREDEMVVWDGRAKNGNLVPAGTYYYVLTFTTNPTGAIVEPDNKVFKDYVVVERE